jgi:hypothetical protein
MATDQSGSPNMSVSIRHIAVATLLAALGGGAAQASGCCGGAGGSGVTNVPPIAGMTGGGGFGTGGGGFTGGGVTGGGVAGGGCCGHVTNHPIGVPGVFVPAPNVSVVVGGPNIGGSNVVVGGPTIVGGSSTTIFGGGAASGGVYYGGGGGYVSSPAPVSPGLIDGLNVGGERVMETVMETRTATETVAIRAVCIDDRGMPHPASRTSGDEQVAAGFDGEMFRCMAGTRMEVAIGRMVDGRAVFDGGRTLSCDKGQALSYKSGAMVCTAQQARAACNERSLLRRYGPGIKYATVTTTQQVATQRQSAQTTSFRSSMFIDGGVGQGVY